MFHLADESWRCLYASATALRLLLTKISQHKNTGAGCNRLRMINRSNNLESHHASLVLIVVIPGTVVHPGNVWRA